MKIKNKLLVICFAATLFAVAKPDKTFAQYGASVSYQTFYDDMQPYGTWVDDPTYGNVWVPDADEGFKPYATSGHWVETPYGNTWVSDYPWGWAAFHYGRWRYDDYYGWEWIPGHTWGPAWVNWRHGGGYYAWAPLGPGISIDISFGGGYHVPDDYWVCAPQAYICNRDIGNYYVPRTRVVTIINRTTIINNTYVNNNVRYASGPRLQEIQQATHNRVQVYNINNGNDPHHTVINNNTVNMYRPTVAQSHGGNAPRPATVVSAAAYKQANPNGGIAHRATYGATVNHDNASRLAQVARNPAPQNQNMVKVNRPAPNNAPANRPAVAAPNGGDRHQNPANNATGQNQNNPVKQQQMKQETPAVQRPSQQRLPQAQQPQTQQRQQNQPQAQPQAQQRQQHQTQPQAQQRQQQQAQQQQAQQRQQQQAQQQQAQQRQQQQAQQQQAQQRQQQQAQQQQAQQRQQQQAQQQHAQQRQQEQQRQTPPQQAPPQQDKREERRP